MNPDQATWLITAVPAKRGSVPLPSPPFQFVRVAISALMPAQSTGTSNQSRLTPFRTDLDAPPREARMMIDSSLA
jgi:hypothetical protein